MSRPTCPTCGKPLPKFSRLRYQPSQYAPGTQVMRGRQPPPMTADGQSPSRGRNGDNLVCGERCGWLLAIRLVAAEPGILKLLPPAYDPEAKAAEAAEARRTASRMRRKVKRQGGKKQLSGDYVADGVVGYIGDD